MPTSDGDALISVVIPVHNEEENVGRLYQELMAVLPGTGRPFEVLFVDDGSTDGSVAALKRLAADHPDVKLIVFRRNYGQTAAMSAGFDHARGGTIVAMDADLQNDPADIPRLLAKLDEGYDLVSGWRKNRHDALVSRKIPSSIANRIISWISGLPLKDYGCSLKAYRSFYLKEIRLFGEMHRFIPIYAHWMGARITELPVNHRPRLHGKSKYGLIRTFKVLLDLVTIKFLGSYSTKPIYLFGGLGLLALVLGTGASVYTLIQKFVYQVWVHRNPMLAISIFFLLCGVMLIMMGLLAEITVRIYHESRRRTPYWIRETINLEDASCAE